MNKPTFVTGGCGFVGRHVIKRLINDSQSVWIVDNLSTGTHPDQWLSDKWKKDEKENLTIYSQNDLTITFINGDALALFTGQVNKNSEIDLPNFKDVIHLASIVGGRELIDGDPLLVATDLAIDAAVFLWATRFPDKLERLLYASSSAAYPTNLQSEAKAVALKEEYIRFDGELGQPDMTYGWSKLSGEYLATLAAARYDLHVACIRPFSGYGEDQDLSYPTPAIALRIARHDSPIDVWGTGEQGRDFIHIDDCVDAMFMILDKVKDGHGINIGTGKLTSFNQLIGTMCEIEKHQAEINRLLDKPVGVQSRYADTTILNKKIGWQPKISLADGLARVLKGAHQRLNNENKIYIV